MQLRPAGELAQRYGVKMVVYGPPGAGKTPLAATAPRPVLCACEPGLLSLRGSSLPTLLATTPKELEDFIRWMQQSADARNYDTICIDSASEMAEIFLREELGKKTKGGGDAHGKKAYGNMAESVMDIMRILYNQQEKHVYLTAKLATIDENGLTVKRPHFPGQKLNTEIPHLFDELFYYALHAIPNVGDRKAFRTRETLGVTARDRSGRLADFEPDNLSNIINKIMQG